jgi:tRNA(Arg) A34 adenosine deaminase TadA
VQLTKKYFKIAKAVAATARRNGVVRKYRIGAVGIRRDGTLVAAANLPTPLPNDRAHAEARLCRKLDVGSVVYVARIDAKGLFRCARPCGRCLGKMRSRGVKRCFYTIKDAEYGVINI